MKTEEFARISMEAMQGMHGEVSRKLAEEWLAMSAKKIELQSRLESLEKDAARWNMFVAISHEVIKHPAHRENQHCIDAYARAIGEGFDCVYAIDTAMQARKGGE